MQIAEAKAAWTCLVCGQVLSANERPDLGKMSEVPHHTCPSEKVRETLLKRAEACDCSAEQLLLARLVVMQCRIVDALGEVSIEQFHNPGPEGFIVMRKSGAGFDIVVEFRPVLLLPALYYETLISPGALQERRAHLLARIREKASSIGKDLTEQQLIEQLEQGEDHWDGRKKVDVAVEILSAQNTAFKALSFAEKDEVLVLPAFEESPRPLRQLAQQVLASLDLCEANAHATHT